MLQWGRNFIVAETRDRHDCYRDDCEASMGPQLYRCGNYLHLSYVYDHAPSFNGAATLSLRKRVGAALVSPWRWLASMGPQLYRCGNVATALDYGHHVHASMGPQLYRCGNAAPFPCPRRSSARFNGAATLSLRKRNQFMISLVRKDLLQWGRNFIVAETSQRDRQPARNTLASMGPQLYRCGNYRTGFQPHAIHRASMGPQLYRCGNVDVLLVLLRDCRASMGPQLYRCGNMPSGASIGRGCSRFNGAATLSLRKRSMSAAYRE